MAFSYQDVTRLGLASCFLIYTTWPYALPSSWTFENVTFLHERCCFTKIVIAERLAMIRQQRAEAAKKREEEKAGMILVIPNCVPLLSEQPSYCYTIPDASAPWSSLIWVKALQWSRNRMPMVSCLVFLVLLFSTFPGIKRLIVTYLFLSAKEQKKAEARKWKIQKTPTR